MSRDSTMAVAQPVIGPLCLAAYFEPPYSRPRFTDHIDSRKLTVVCRCC